jgi:hypothetical protein
MTIRTTCRSCGADLIWCQTEKGKPMPVDAAPDEKGNLIVWSVANTWKCRYAPHNWDGPRHRPHFASCPDAESWRKR